MIHLSPMSDARLMTTALTLARRGLGQVWPNPAVGCVLVAPDNRIVGQGWTQPGGRPHAETVALAEAGAAAHAATAYVTLEPCAHHGHTPPCADALIAAGIRHCVVALRDPDPRVAGRGIARLVAAGIAVTEGVEHAAARALNRGFLQRLQTGRPWVAVKVAASLDGRIALESGASRWITGPQARAYGHWLRASFDAIMAGTGTIAVDDPELTCRLPGLAGRSPLRILLDRQGILPPESRALSTDDGMRPLLVTAHPAHPAAGKADILQLRADATAVPLPEVLAELGQRGLTRLLVEGGARLVTALILEDLVDEIFWFGAPKLLGADALPALGALALQTLPPCWKVIERRSLGPDQLFILRKD